MSIKYWKSKSQREKEKRRRERLFQMLTEEEWFTESEMADRLGVSRSTVQRDKRKLLRRLERHYIDLNLKVYSELKHRIDQMTDRELIRLLGVFMRKKRVKGKPRGKSFTKEYQPRWKRR